MALGHETAEQLWQELVGGYNLNVRLLALLGHPLDIHGQEAAVAMSQELSRVFMVSLFTLKPGDSSQVAGARTMAPEATSTGQCSLAKDKRICSGEEVAPNRKSRGDEVTKREFTASPYRNGYRWKKYGQKNIQDSKFPRFYFSCTHSRGRGCRAKKRVQQQEETHPPIFQVTYVNEHTCHHQVLPGQNDISSAANLPATATATATATRSGAHFDPAVRVGDNAGLEEEIMICTLSTVIGGVPSPRPRPPPVEVSQLSGPSSYVPMSMGSLEHETTVAEMGFSCGSPPFPPVMAPAAPSSSLSSLPPLLPVEASSSCPAARGNLPRIDHAMTMEEMYFACGPLFSSVAAQSINHWDDGPMADASAWPQFS